MGSPANSAAQASPFGAPSWGSLLEGGPLLVHVPHGEPQQALPSSPGGRVSLDRSGASDGGRLLDFRGRGRAEPAGGRRGEAGRGSLGERQGGTQTPPLPAQSCWFSCLGANLTLWLISGHGLTFPSGYPRDQRPPLPGNHTIPGAMSLPGAQEAQRGCSFSAILPTAPHSPPAQTSQELPRFAETPGVEAAVGRRPTEAGPLSYPWSYRGCSLP